MTKLADDADVTKLVDTHAQRIIDALATDTGVDRNDVAKIVQRLGLENALASRLKVTIDDIRIAMPSPPI